MCAVLSRIFGLLSYTFDQLDPFSLPLPVHLLTRCTLYLSAKESLCALYTKECSVQYKKQKRKEIAQQKRAAICSRSHQIPFDL